MVVEAEKAKERKGRNMHSMVGEVANIAEILKTNVGFFLLLYVVLCFFLIIVMFANRLRIDDDIYSYTILCNHVFIY